MADLKLLQITLDGNNYVIPEASATEKGLLTPTQYEQFSKGEANVINEVKLNGQKVEIASKIVDIIIEEGKTSGTINVGGTDVKVKGLAALAYLAEVTEDELETALAAKVNAGDQASKDVATIKTTLQTLQGTSDGSIKKQIDDALTTWAEYTTQNDKVDTFKELVEWVAKHGTEAGELTETLNKVEDILEGIGGDSEPSTVMEAINQAIEEQVDLSDYAKTADIDKKLEKKVDAEAGKQLSTEDFTSAFKTKLEGIATGATKVTYSYNAASGNLTLSGIVAEA